MTSWAVQLLLELCRLYGPMFLALWRAGVIFKIYLLRNGILFLTLSHSPVFVQKYIRSWRSALWTICHLGLSWQNQFRQYVTGSRFQSRDGKVLDTQCPFLPLWTTPLVVRLDWHQLRDEPFSPLIRFFSSDGLRGTSKEINFQWFDMVSVRLWIYR